MWAWGLVNIDDPDLRVDIDNTIESFCDHVAMMDSPIVYFHNLAFDGVFILDHLLRNGYSYLADGRLMCGEFQTLISKEGKFYSITVRWMNGKRVEFRDSLKKLPMTVAKVAKSFKQEECKLTIDYHTPRPVGHVITDAEAEYLAHDVRIIARALKIQLDQGMIRLTVGADSLAEFKHLFGKKTFDQTFPILSPSMDEEVRRAYRGGWTYADARWRGKVMHKHGKVYDVNSLYPSVMYDRVLPWDTPIFCHGEPKPTESHPLFITCITFTARLRDGFVPCIQIKGSMSFMPSVYQTEIVEPVTLACTNIDLALWQEHYEMDILSWDGSWLFRGASGLFNEYIDKWMQIKITSDGGMREIAKLHLNSLYGKFATNPNVTGKYPVLGKNDTVEFKLGPEETRNPVYTPMGVFITAYARDVTIRAAQLNYGSFAYADTDSLHLFVDGHPDNLDIDPNKLGAWKHEMTFDAAIYVRAKCYSERHADKTICTCEHKEQHEGKSPCLCGVTVHGRACGYATHISGVPLEIAKQLTFDDFYNNHVFHGKLTSRVVRGGVVLTDTPFKLTDPSLTVDLQDVTV